MSSEYRTHNVARRPIEEGKATPGSREAISDGCTCAQMDNSYGAGYRPATEGRPAEFIITGGCPLHWPEEGNA